MRSPEEYFKVRYQKKCVINNGQRSDRIYRIQVHLMHLKVTLTLDLFENNLIPSKMQIQYVKCHHKSNKVRETTGVKYSTQAYPTHAWTHEGSFHVYDT